MNYFPTHEKTRFEKAREKRYPHQIGTTQKCNFCAERLRDKKEPACVEAARDVEGGDGALTFGNLRDANSEVRQLLQEKHTVCRRPSIGTRPNVFYIV